MSACPTCGIDPAKLTAIREQVERLISGLVQAEDTGRGAGDTRTQAGKTYPSTVRNDREIPAASLVPRPHRVTIWQTDYGAETAREQAQRSVDA